MLFVVVGFCFVAVGFFFFFFSVLVQDLHPTEIGDMYFRFHYNFYIFLASSPPAAPDERGHTHILRSAAEEGGGGEKKKREKTIRKRRKKKRHPPRNRFKPTPHPRGGQALPGAALLAPPPARPPPVLPGEGGGGVEKRWDPSFSARCVPVCVPNKRAAVAVFA